MLYICDMETKVCCKCGVEKDKSIENYNFNKSKNIFVGACKECIRKKRREEYEKNPEKFLNKNNKWRKENVEKVKEIKKKEYQNNKEKYSEYNKEYRKKNLKLIKENQKNYYENNKKRISKTMKIWRDNNKDYMLKYNKKYKEDNKNKLNEWNRVYRNERRNTDPLFKLKDVMRNNMTRWLNGKKVKNTEEILGCTFEFFREYIKKQFEFGMSWDNWGKDTWHLDHHIPLSSAKTEEDVYRLNHYTNFKPLWAEDNLKKSNKISEEWGNKI